MRTEQGDREMQIIDEHLKAACLFSERLDLELLVYLIRMAQQELSDQRNAQTKVLSATAETT
ncbi:hypothetical protein [Rhizobium sp. FKY42]|uniref:hypothetical protein n=1 Tax=Rhizobium sp. FKY42 TaxID=2562310 RepID=UPI0010BFE0CB|nr:hypothetical protein [Rhizobium sp. FKY42]